MEKNQVLLTPIVVMLPQMRTDKGNELQLYLHMSRAKGPDERRVATGAVRRLWLQRLRIQ